MPAFPLLAEPDHYVACEWDLTTDREGLDYWIAHFHEHARTLDPLVRDVYQQTPLTRGAKATSAFDGRLERWRREYLTELDRLHAEPDRFGRVTILALDRLRDRYLRMFGFDDPYRTIKRKENEAALAVYPTLIAELDSQPDDPRMAELIAGVFAGNIFDLGAMATVRQYHEAGLDFFATRSKLPARPWLADDADAMAAAWSAGAWRYRKVVFFADNAGCDFVLGCLPLIREFAARRGAEVVVTVNTGPSLNDILPDEVAFVLAETTRADAVLAEAVSAGRIRVVPSGNTAPLIDLADVSAELADAAAGADLVILEGMGRSVESNRLARFTVDTAKMALLKDPRVAGRIGGKLFDVCCRFEPAPL